MSEPVASCFGRDLDRDGWPSVSVVVPVRNEAPHLAQAVASTLSQRYPESFDVCLAVAPSVDDTLDVALRLAREQPRVSVVANPSAITPAGLNAAIAATTGEIVVRVDGHAILPAGYIRRAVETMVRTGAVNVGGMQVPQPETPFEQAVADATTSWMGTGGAAYRVGGDEGPVDTVYLGVFDRAAGDAVGWFDEALIRNQDYELNVRLRQAGGTIWFDPSLQVGYRPRSTWRSLAKQYFEYGWWKAEVLRRHPGSLKARQMAPPVAATAVVAGLLYGIRCRIALCVPIAYGVAVLAVHRNRRSPLRVAAITATIHASWSAGIVAGGIGPNRATDVETS